MWYALIDSLSSFIVVYSCILADTGLVYYKHNSPE